MSEQAGAIERALIQLLCDHGLDALRADSVAGELLREYPLVRRHGLEHVAQLLRRFGMATEAATDAALQLLAFELLGRVAYGRVLELMSAHAPPRDALAICLRAAQLRREATRETRTETPRALRSRLTRFASSWLGSR